MHSSAAIFFTAAFSAAWAEGLLVSNEHTMNLAHGVDGDVDSYVIDNGSAHVEEGLVEDKITHFVVQTEDNRKGGVVPEGKALSAL